MITVALPDGVGVAVGAAVGGAVGVPIGVAVGGAVGVAVGRIVGDGAGVAVGEAVGEDVGAGVGLDSSVPTKSTPVTSRFAKVTIRCVGVNVNRAKYGETTYSPAPSGPTT